MYNQFKTIDLTYLKTIADGNDDIIRELVQIFIEQVPEFTEGLQDGFKAKDWVSIAAIAHKAKSSVISMGMTDLGEKDLKNLELTAKNRRIKELALLHDKSPAQTNELDKLTQNLLGYSEEKQKWVIENDKDETIKKIIDKFVATCDIALTELKTVL